MNQFLIDNGTWEILQGLKHQLEIEGFFKNYALIARVCDSSQKITIECDKNGWHKLPNRKDLDNSEQEKYAKASDYHSLRLWYSDIRKNSKEILDSKFKALLERSQIMADEEIKNDFSPEFQKVMDALDEWVHANADEERCVSFIASFTVFDKELNVLDKDGPMIASGPKEVLQIHLDSLQEELNKEKKDAIVNW